MKAYRVIYVDVNSEISETNVLTNKQVCTINKDIENLVAEKDKDFIVGSQWCEIKLVNEISLSEVMIKDLTVSELLKILNNSR